MNKRYQERMRKDTIKMIQDLEEEAEIRLSMQRETEYEQKIAPYLHAIKE